MSNIVIVGYGNAEAIKFYELSKSLEEVRTTMGRAVESCDKLKDEVSKLADIVVINNNFNPKLLHSNKRRNKSWEKNKFWK